MPRTYELAFVIEPRRSEDEVQAMIDKYKEIIEAGEAEVTYVYLWGKRKLAYPIQKITEGIYVVLYVTAEGQVAWPDVERLMSQDEQILRYLVVRTDEDLKRAERAKVKPRMPWDKEEKTVERSTGSR